MNKFAVIGHPISQSKSPLIHSYWMSAHDIDATYEAIDIAPENFGRALRALLDRGYRGFNLTVPHKIMALDLCDEISDVARAIGAVNTVHFSDGILYGTNTDAFGFLENLKQQLPNIALRQKPVTVIGAGGAARACVYALLSAGVSEVRIINRTRAKAEAVAGDDARVVVCDWHDLGSAFADTALLVNTTSLGMVGQPPLMLDLSSLPQDAVAYDIVYTPMKTEFLCACEARGNEIVTGLGMLGHQARQSFEVWFGVLPDYDDVLDGRLIGALGGGA